MRQAANYGNSDRQMQQIQRITHVAHPVMAWLWKWDSAINIPVATATTTTNQPSGRSMARADHRNQPQHLPQVH